jgi:hypothetical protein
MRPVDFSALTWFYFSSVVIGYYVLPLLFTITLTFLLLYPLRRWTAIPVGAIITVFVYYLLMDGLAYRVTKIHIDFFWLEWIINDFSGFGLPPSTLRNMIVALVVIIAIETGIFVIVRNIRRPKHLIPITLVLTIMAFGTSQITHAIAYEKNDDRITSLTPQLPAYVPITSHKNAFKYGRYLPFGDKGPGSIASDPQGALKYPLAAMKYRVAPDTKPPNIVVVFLESWRHDAMNEHVTPNIFALSKKSSVFLNHFATGNSTVAGVFGFFYGLDPTYWTAVKANNVRIDNPVIIDALQENDYAFGIFAKSNFKRHKIKDAIFRGIEVRESFAGRTIVEQDRDLTSQVVSYIRERQNYDNPYFVFAFFKSSHSPYRYPPEDSVFLPAEDINMMFADDDTDPVNYRNDYMNSVHYLDRLTGDIIAELDSLGDLANTVVIITTDHSDELNDNRANYWGHGSNFTKYQTMIPLVVYIPDREPQRVEYVTSHLDIAPTLLEGFLGCTNEISNYSGGRSLFEKPTGVRPLVIGSYVNHAIVIEDNVYEIYPLHTRKYKLHDIKSEASAPSREALMMLATEIGRFYEADDRDSRGELTATLFDDR